MQKASPLPGESARDLEKAIAYRLARHGTAQPRSDLFLHLGSHFATDATPARLVCEDCRVVPGLPCDVLYSSIPVVCRQGYFAAWRGNKSLFLSTNKPSSPLFSASADYNLSPVHTLPVERTPVNNISTCMLVSVSCLHDSMLGVIF